MLTDHFPGTMYIQRRILVLSTILFTRSLAFHATLSTYANPSSSSSSVVLSLSQQGNGISDGDNSGSGGGVYDAVVAASTKAHFPPDKARTVLDDHLVPSVQYGDRIGLGRDAQGLQDTTGELIRADDERLDATYGEFPYDSLDRLIDLAMSRMTTVDSANGITFVDFGSGCGRLLFYLALTRLRWKLGGIEIASLLHDEGVRCMELAKQMDIFSGNDSHDANGIGSASNPISLYCGDAKQYGSVLRDANLIFAYSTTFPAKEFSPELTALVLDDEWTALFDACSEGCIVITTDRALNPNRGWRLIDRLEVDNSEVFGSMGYIQIRESY